MTNLGNCDKCQSRLAVVQRNKYRMAGDQKVLLTEEGHDLRQDDKGRLNGKPALEWLVACSDCGKEHRQHPHQKVLEDAMAKAKKNVPPPPAFMHTNYTEVNGFDAQDRRLTALESSMMLLDGRVENVLAQVTARVEALFVRLEALEAAASPTNKRAKKASVA